MTAPLAAAEQIMGIQQAHHAKEHALTSLKIDWSGTAVGDLVPQAV